MNYIGSKLKLCQNFIIDTIKSVCGKDLSQKIFCDIFAGTGIVGRTFKSSVKKVISNDVEYYSYVLNKNYIENHHPIKDKQLFIKELNTLPLTDNGFIYRMRVAIENWREEGIVSDDLYYFLLCSLIECADKVANTASVYGAFLKKLKKTALKEFVIEPAEYELTDNEHEVFNKEAGILIEEIEGDILYLDPPYNARQYGANYHILNTIAEQKPFIPSGRTGLRSYFRSIYCSSYSV